MIIKHIKMKTAASSRFANLVNYLLDAQNNQERVGKVTITNCHSNEPRWAVEEVLATQAQNSRAKGCKTYHLLISFAKGEQPDTKILKNIEHQVVSSVGFDAHQRISVVHHDTDNLHIHLAINKIHPKTLRMIEPYRAYHTFAQMAIKLEQQYNLIQTNHQPRKSQLENLANDMEHHSNMQSMINWMKCHCHSQINNATSWRELHAILTKHGLSIRERGNGLVFCNENGLSVKASAISRDFSKRKLEAKLGQFQPSLHHHKIKPVFIYQYQPLNQSKKYQQYLAEKASKSKVLYEQTVKLKLERDKKIKQAKCYADLKRATLKLTKMPRLMKQYLYKQIHNKYMGEVSKIMRLAASS